MKKIALLTTENLGDHILDEDRLEKALENYSDVRSEYLPWSSDANWSDYDMVVIRTTWDYTQKHKEFLKALNKISQSGAKLFNSYELVSWNVDKIYLRTLSEKGVSTVESLYFDEPDFIEKAKSFKSDRFIVKPRIGASSEGINFVNLSELESIQKVHAEKQTHFVQPFIKEIHQGECSYFFFNGEYKYAIRKTPKDGDFRVQEEYGGIITVHEPGEQELKEAKKTVDAVEEFKPLYLRVDAVLTEQGQWKLMELEAIEPSMFFRVVFNSAEDFAKAMLERL